MGDRDVDDVPLGSERLGVDRRPIGYGFVVGRRAAAEKRFRGFQGQVLLRVALPMTLVPFVSVPALASISVPISEQSVAEHREDHVCVPETCESCRRTSSACRG